LEECILEDEELGMKVTSDSAEEHAHVAWADRVQQLAAAVLDNDGLLIASTWKALPSALRALISDQHTTWKAFCNAIRATWLSAILEQRVVENDRNEIKKMKNKLEAERIRRLQDTPSKAVTASLRSMNIGTIEPLRFTPLAQP